MVICYTPEPTHWLHITFSSRVKMSRYGMLAHLKEQFQGQEFTLEARQIATVSDVASLEEIAQEARQWAESRGLPRNGVHFNTRPLEYRRAA